MFTFFSFPSSVTAYSAYSTTVAIQRTDGSAVDDESVGRHLGVELEPCLHTGDGAEHGEAIGVRLEFRLCKELEGTLSEPILAPIQGRQGFASLTFDFIWVKSWIEEGFADIE